MHTIVLLMMGIMMPEEFEIKFDNKHHISCNLLVSLSSPIENFYMILTLHSVFRMALRTVSNFCFLQHKLVGFIPWWRVLTALYGLIACMKQITFCL